MDFISPFIEPVLSRIWNPLVRQIRYVAKAKTNMEDMNRAMGDLDAEKGDILKKKEDGRRTQQKSTTTTERWLEKVDKVEAEVMANRDRYAQRGCVLLGACSLNCWSTYKTSRKASQLHVKMTTLKAEIERKDVGELLRAETIGHGQSMPTSTVMMGVVEHNVAKVCGYLNEDRVGVIGIHGMGGVGKTTLLKEINNFVVREKNMGFESHIFVVVSKECQLRTLQTRLAESLGLQVSDADDDNKAAIKIFNYLKERSFLLLLDDMWEAMKLDEVGIPDPRKTNKVQKVVITTRFLEVCGEMYADKTIKVECLDKENALILFHKSVGEWIHSSSPRIKSFAEKIADECGGLPLALNVTGKAMSSKRSVEAWQDAFTSLKKPQASNILYKDNTIFKTLEFSYHNLKSDALRQCFLFCSLWPEDGSIDEEEIIEYCIGQEYIEGFDDISEAWNKGKCLIEELKGACLLEPDSEDKEYSAVKMHDVVRDLALWIQSDRGQNPSKCVVKAGIRLREAPPRERDSKIWAEEAQVISLMSTHINVLGPTTTNFNCPSLLLRFTARNNHSLSLIHPCFFQHMTALTFLDLSWTGIRELPPDIGELKMLQHLVLFCCFNITCLPKEVGNLVKLRYLNLRGTSNLRHIPSGVISCLSELQVLDLFDSGYGFNVGKDDEGSSSSGVNDDSGEIDDTEREGGSGVGSAIMRKDPLFDLEQLQGSLKALGISIIRSIELFQRLSAMSRIFTWRLELENLSGVTALNLKRNMWQYLQQLYISDCNDTRVLEFCGAVEEDDDYCPVETVYIDRLLELEEIIWCGFRPMLFLPGLRRVDIDSCPRLKNVSWLLQLPSLVDLNLQHCNNLEKVIASAEAEDIQHTEATFPTLKILFLERLPNLTCICDSAVLAFPALEKLKVRICPKLQDFPFQLMDLNKLKSVRFNREWWEQLEQKPMLPESVSIEFDEGDVDNADDNEGSSSGESYGSGENDTSQ